MGIDLHIKGRALSERTRQPVEPTVASAALAAGASAGTSFAFHRLGPPALSRSGAWRATAGTAILSGLATGVIAGTSRSGALHDGVRSNSMLESTLLGAGAAGAVGWHPLFHGRTVSNTKGAALNVVLGLMVSPVIHVLTAPD